MPILNRDKLDAASKAFNVLFADALARPLVLPAGAPTEAELGFRLQATTKTVNHIWLAFLGTWKKWVGERNFDDLLAQDYMVSDEKWEDSVKIPVEAFEDDTYGLFGKGFQMMAAGAAMLPRRLMIDDLIANSIWADGSDFYKADRTMGKATWKNLVTDALSRDALNAGIATMTETKAPDGVTNLGVVPRYLVVGNKLRATGNELVVSKTISAGTGKGGMLDNPDLGRVELRVMPELTGDYDDYWFILGERAGLQGLGYQDRVSPKIATSEELVFMEDMVCWGGRARGKAFKTLPPLIYHGRVA